MVDNVERIAAIILSAGFSSRMGRFKPLLKLGEFTAIEHAVRCFWQVGIRDIRVVTGHRAQEMTAAVAPMGVTVVHNDRYEEGMFSSVQAGVRTLEPAVEAFFLLPVDAPLVMAATIKAMVEVYHSCGKGILYPTFHGKRGHPPLIAARYAGAILHGDAPDGLRGLLNHYHEDAEELEVTDESVLLDMDVPADYELLQAHLAWRKVPTLVECQRLLHEVGVDQRIWEHCHHVAGLAVALTRQLHQAGTMLDEALVLAGALLHDVARQQPDHARVGASLIRERGYPRVAEVVAVHMDMEVASDQSISEAQVVYLADKMIKGSHMISITERLADLAKKYQGDPEALMAASRRLLQAQQIKMKVEQILGIQVESMVPLDLSFAKPREQFAGDAPANGVRF